MAAISPQWIIAFLLTIPAAAQAQDRASAIATEAKPWLYPKANKVSTSEVSGQMYQTVMTTPDDFAKVRRFYFTRCGGVLAKVLAKQPAEGKPRVGILNTELTTIDKIGHTITWTQDSITRTDGPERGVRLDMLVSHTKARTVTVTISRTKTDKTTHIVLLYVKK